MTKKIAFALIVIFSAMIIFVSCNNENEPDYSDIPDGIDMDLIERVGKRFEEIYLTYNEKRFDEYVAYYKIDDEQKKLMLEALKTNSETYESKYEIYNVLASESDDGLISATIVYRTVSSNADGQSLIIEETMYYKLMEENGELFISSYEMGAQTLIE